ncbi:MAG: methionine--tRNA ligase [Deltaproteobacteria bacterium]|nr:methionine--tRNA ligase [Deltaproteobacteria bacterium]NIS76350.1 methionine--tRNA ligase [Deltaproteobacteria bacterium]
MGRKFYVTTPIYYVNDIPHIGHAYTTIAADVLARYRRLTGHDVFFLTGTDEHGEKVHRSAVSQGFSPKELADRVVTRFQGLTPALGITNDDFIRTSEPRHYASVQHLFRKSLDGGDIYLGEYEGWYCTPDESYWTDRQLRDGKCPECGREVEKRKEPSYFFRLSKYQQPLLDLYAANPTFIQPETRRNEVISFVSEGLNDLSLSRTSLTWGIPVPDDPGHVIYVWFDALTNYITGVGYPDDTDAFSRYWPADVHIIGKDILRFHAVYWPAFLISAGIKPPGKVFAHGWWTVEGQKMSKSLGNVVDPYDVAEKYGVDQVRYFLFREVPFGLDGDFSHGAMVHRINSDLANDFGNLLNRTLNMLSRYLAGRVPARGNLTKREQALAGTIRDAVAAIEGQMENLEFHKALASIWDIVGAANKYIDDTAPWSLAKDPEKRERLGTVLYAVLETVRIVTILASPFTPVTAEKIWQILGQKGPVESSRIPESTEFGLLEEGIIVPDRAIVFPRIE